ncbi:hypothetical protein Hanom_Chr00s003917g01716701 [Helianthus anomalus]
MFRSKFCEFTRRNVRIWFNIFTYSSKFCNLTRCNVRVWFNVFTLSIFFLFDKFVAIRGF